MIDQARLQELAEDFGEEELATIVDVFLAETWEALDDLGGMLSDGPSEARADHFHFLKGCARNLGAQAFGDRCEALETAHGPFDEAAYRALRAEFQAVCDWFRDGGLKVSA